jgi:predicted N-formylglutamate amidohydrolase
MSLQRGNEPVDLEVRQPLLAPDEPSAVETVNAAGRSAYVVTCEHAGHAIPRALGTLGLDEAERMRHIGWDIGAAAVARRLSDMLDAPLVLQTYSRLVIDCNRTLDRPDSIPTVSETTEIPGNRDLAAGARRARAEEIHKPYHDEIVRLLDGRREAGIPTMLIAMHSFTPVFKGTARPWHVGFLFNRDARLTDALLPHAHGDGDLTVGINEPYAISDLTDYTIPVHGERRGMPHLEFEVRQDLIETAAGQRAWADRLGRWLAHVAADAGPVFEGRR